MSYVVVVTYRAQEGAAEKVKGHLEHMVAPTNREPGCRSYDVYRSLDDEAVFVLVEVYDDEAAFQQHRAADYFDEHIVKGAIPLLAHREVVRGAPL
jgi:quinol monooxygenase YgiN